MENLVNSTNDKSASDNQKIIRDMTNLCVLAIIFSDFEIEIFFEIENFSPNFQKNILFETITFCSDRQKELENYITLKFQFWILKLVNSLLIEKGDIIEDPSTSTVTEEELKVSLAYLKKYIDQSLIEKSEDNLKILYIKIAYELGLYNYLNGKFKEMEGNFTFLLNNIKTIDKQKFYFDIESIEKIMKYYKDKKNEMDIEDDEILSEDIVSNNLIFDLNNIDFEIESNSNLLKTDFGNFSEEFHKKNQEKEEYSKFLIKDISLIEYSSIEDNLKLGFNLIQLTLDNMNYLNDAIQFNSKLKDSISSQVQNNPSKNHEIELLKANREILFYLELLKLIELMSKNEQKLPKKFFKNLSNTIIKNTLTDNLRISGLLHTLILNFNNMKAMYNYFNDYIEFFQTSGNSTKNKTETINQIIFISRFVTILYLYLNDPSQTDKIIIDDDKHINLMNIFFFWLEQKNNNVYSPKYDKDINIAYIIIDALKIKDYLQIFKIIYLGVLKFIIDKKHLKGDSINNNNDIYVYLYEKNTQIFKINSLINEEINYLSMPNKEFIFKESNSKNKSYQFNTLQINGFIYELFELLIKLEENIVKNKSNLKEKDILLRKNSLNFFEIIENDFSLGEKNQKISQVINDYLNFFKLNYEDFKQKYFQFDIMENITLCIKLYEEFSKEMKKEKNQTILLQFIYLLCCGQRYFEASIFLQYKDKMDYNLAYKLLELSLNNSSSIDFELFQYIWKPVYFEYLSNFYFKKKNNDAVNKIKYLLRRISNHQFFKKHPLRKHFKIINFFKLIDNL